MLYLPLFNVEPQRSGHDQENNLAIGEQACVTNAGTNTVSVINTSTNTVTTTVPVGANPVNTAIF